MPCISQVAGRLEEISEVTIDTQESAVRIIDKRGPLSSPADRDHCLQYMVAVALLHGELRSEHYRDAAAADPRIERLRRLTTVREEPRFTRDYLDPARRAIGNRVQVRFKDGSATPPVEVAYPLGHPRRRAEAMPLLRAKFAAGVGARFTPGRVRRRSNACGTIPNVPTGSASISSSTASPTSWQAAATRCAEGYSGAGPGNSQLASAVSVVLHGCSDRSRRRWLGPPVG